MEIMAIFSIKLTTHYIFYIFLNQNLHIKKYTNARIQLDKSSQIGSTHSTSPQMKKQNRTSEFTFPLLAQASPQG